MGCGGGGRSTKEWRGVRAQGNDEIFSALLKGKSFSASLELFSLAFESVLCGPKFSTTPLARKCGKHC